MTTHKYPLIPAARFRPRHARQVRRLGMKLAQHAIEMELMRNIHHIDVVLTDRETHVAFDAVIDQMYPSLRMRVVNGTDQVLN